MKTDSTCGHSVCPHTYTENSGLIKEARVSMWLESLYFFSGCDSITQLERFIWGNQQYAAGNSRVKKLDKYTRCPPAQPSKRRISEVGKVIPNSVQVYDSPLWSSLESETNLSTNIKRLQEIAGGTLEDSGRVLNAHGNMRLHIVELSWSATELDELAVCILSFQIARIKGWCWLAMNIAAALYANLPFQYALYKDKYPSFKKVIHLIIAILQTVQCMYFRFGIPNRNLSTQFDTYEANVMKVYEEIKKRYPRRKVDKMIRNCIIFMHHHGLIHLLYKPVPPDINTLIDCFQDSLYVREKLLFPYLWPRFQVPRNRQKRK